MSIIICYHMSYVIFITALIVWDWLCWVHGRSGVIIDMCPFEAHCMPHVMSLVLQCVLGN